jgi:hypothetical protein
VTATHRERRHDFRDRSRDESLHVANAAAIALASSSHDFAIR